MRGGIGSAYLGNLGGASIPLDAALRPDYRNFSFAQILDAYLVHPRSGALFLQRQEAVHAPVLFLSAVRPRRLEESFLGHPCAERYRLRRGMNVDYQQPRYARDLHVARVRASKQPVAGLLAHRQESTAIHAGYIYNMASLKENGGIHAGRGHYRYGVRNARGDRRAV
ncbi:MAG: hypothetical protein ACLTZY_09515 [Alistipes indistinctus]